MKIIIAGAGEVGSHVARLLCNANHDVTILDSELEKMQILESQLDLLTVYGHVTSVEDLKRAKVDECDLFISVPPFESLSLMSAILAKKLGAKVTIARINNKEYFLPETRGYFKSLGIDEMIYPEQLATEEIIESLKRIGVRQCVEFADGNLMIFAVKLGESAAIVGRTVAEAVGAEDRDVIGVMAIVRGGNTIIPTKKERFQAGDRVYFITIREGVAHITKKTGKKPFSVKNVMILGGSRIGRKIAEEIEGSYRLKLIESDQERAEELADRLSKTLVIHGDGKSADLMREEGIANVDAFIAVTGNSEVNILACQLAKKLGVKKTVAEIENLDYLDFAETIGIGTVVNKKILAAGMILKYTFQTYIPSAKWLMNTDCEVLELVASPDSLITQHKIGDLALPHDVNIGGIIRGKNTFIVNDESRIFVGDKVVIFAHHKQISAIESFFVSR